MEQQQAHELELEESPRFAQREALAERLGWLVMAAVVVAAALGLFANGPLSHRTVASDEVSLRYQRFGRSQGRTTLEVEAPAGAAIDGKIEVWVAQQFLESYEVEEVRPEPEATSTSNGGVVFSFALDGDDTALKATLTLRPEQTGRHRGAVAVASGRPATFTQFVYP
ncbi:MAG: hypothetical protein KY458_08910 [Actinobacteria bacterium]|nr:hypothetical protein [Actinomycetota bacterium]